MTELTELEEAMRNLKKDNVEKKRLVSELESEKKYVAERNRFLIEKLKQAGVLYEESGKRLTDFVNENLKPLKARLAEFEAMSQKTREYEKSVESALKKVNDFGAVIGSFRNEMVKNSEKQAEISAKMEEVKKSHAEISRRISTIQTFGSEELAAKVEDIKAKFGENVRKIEDEYGVLKLGVSGAIDNFKKDFERYANALRNDMEKIDIKKAKELGDALARTTEELNASKADFARSLVSLEKEIEKLDVKKSKEMSKSIDLLSANIEERLGGMSTDLDKRLLAAESDLNKFRIELEKTLGKAKVETRDFIASKSSEFDSLLADLREKMNVEMKKSAAEWNDNLGSLRSDLINTKIGVESLIGAINKKVEMGEERREKRLDTGLASMQAASAKKIESAAGEIYAHVNDLGANIDETRADFAKRLESVRKATDLGEVRRKKEIDKILKEFMFVKGQVDGKIKEVASEIGKLSMSSETIRRQAIKESLAGVQEKSKAIFDSMEKKFEVVENGLIDKVASIESDFDEFGAGFRGTISSLKAEMDEKIEALRSEFGKMEVSRDKEASVFAKSVQKDVDVRLAALAGKLDNKLSKAEDELTSMSKTVDNFTVDLSEKFESIIQTKTKEFEKMVKSLVSDLKSMERSVNAAIGDFKGEMEKRETQKKSEIERMLREFVTAKGRADEKMLQIDKKMSEFSEVRKEMKKEIYRDSLAGVQERVKDIVAGLEERLNASKDESSNKIGELIKSTDDRIRETETSLNGFRVDLEKTLGKLRTDVDKATGKKTSEIDKIAASLRNDFEERVKIVNAELLANFEDMKNEVVSLKGELAKNITFIRKEFEAGEAKRADKTEKSRIKLDKEFNSKLNEFAIAMHARVKSAETEINSLKLIFGKASSELKGKFDEVIADKTGEFEGSMDEVMEKAEKARREVETIAENLKSEFVAEGKERKKETENSLRDLLILKGEMTRRMKEIDGEIAKFSSIKNSLKNEIARENSAMIASSVASLTENVNREMTGTKKSLKTEVIDVRVYLDKAVEKIGRLNDKIDAMKEEVFAIKKTRSLLIDDVKSFSKTMEANSDAKLRTFMKDIEKSLHAHENIINSKIADIEKRVGAVNEHVYKSKKEKDEELDELLRHVES
jgi:DNA repair exonuclease SbcCD ATPase subunit